jgi:hypothetical protein
VLVLSQRGGEIAYGPAVWGPLGPGAFHRLAQTPPSQDSYDLATVFRSATDVIDRSCLFGRDATGVLNDLVGQRLPP